MNTKRAFQNKVRNLIHTICLLSVMVSVTGLVSYFVLGIQGVWIAFFSCVFAVFLSGKISMERLLTNRGAERLSPMTYGEVYRAAEIIAKRAGLIKVPQLFYERSKAINAYAAGSKEDPYIVFTDSLLSNLNGREIVGILGHETAHIKNNDLNVMNMADYVQRYIDIVSSLGQIFLLFALPVMFFKGVPIALIPVLFIIFAPSIVRLLQLALSRTREFEADTVGVELTGDPIGLAQALSTLEKYHRVYWRHFIVPPWTQRTSSLLQTHPKTSVRIARLLELVDASVKQRVGQSGKQLIRTRFQHPMFL